MPISSTDEAFKKYDGLVGIGNGKKIVGGKMTDEDAVLFFVKKKKDVQGSGAIPKTISGKKTDVIELGTPKSMLLTPPRISTYQKPIKPLRGGIQISATSSTAGTVGAIVKDAITGRLLGITNAHVTGNPIYDPRKQGNVTNVVGLDVYQPTTSGSQVGKVVVHSIPRISLPGNRTNMKYDISLFSIDSDYGVTVGILGLTKKPQVFVDPLTVSIGSTIYKAGRTTGVTGGTLTSIDATMSVAVNDNGDVAVYEDQMIVRSNDTIIVDHGDSGSVACIDLGNGVVGIIGLLFAGGTASDGSTYYLATKIDTIARDFGIKPWDGTIVARQDSNLVFAGSSEFANAGTTMLSVTNDYVCSGEGCIANIRPCGCVHECRSFSGIIRGDIKLNVTQLFITGTCNANIGIATTLETRSGMICNVPVLLDIAMDAKANIGMAIITNIKLSLDVLAAVSLVNAKGSLAITNSNVNVSCVCVSTIIIACVAGCDTDVVFIVDTSSTFVMGVGLNATMDVDIGFNVKTISTAEMLGCLSVGDPLLAVAECDGGNCNDLSYGGML